MYITDYMKEYFDGNIAFPDESKLCEFVKNYPLGINLIERGDLSVNIVDIAFESAEKNGIKFSIGSGAQGCIYGYVPPYSQEKEYGHLAYMKNISKSVKSHPEYYDFLETGISISFYKNPPVTEGIGQFYDILNFIVAPLEQHKQDKINNKQLFAELQKDAKNKFVEIVCKNCANDLDKYHLFDKKSIRLVLLVFIDYKYLCYEHHKIEYSYPNPQITPLIKENGYQRTTQIGKCPHLSHLYAKSRCSAKDCINNGKDGYGKCEKYTRFLQPEYDLQKMALELEAIRNK